MAEEAKIIGRIERKEDNMKVDLKSILKGDITERLNKIEMYCKVKFPNSYVKFITKYNMAVPITNIFTLGNKEYIIERFLGIDNEYRTSSFGSFDIAVVLSQLDTRLTNNPNLIGDEIIPVAMLFAGDYLCLDYRDNLDEPKVCIWYHEESEEFSPYTKEVAGSFKEFLEILA